MTTPAEEAAEAARNAHDISTAGILGHFHGRCLDCGETFDYEYGDGQHRSPCPNCESHNWVREDEELSEQTEQED